MQLRKTLGMCVQFLILAVSVVILQVCVARIMDQQFMSLMPAGPAPAGASAAVALGALIVARTCQAITLGIIALRSRWAGWKLAATLSFVQFTIETFLSQIESIVFLTGPLNVNNMTMGAVEILILRGIVFSALIGPLTVLVMGKARSGCERGNEQLNPNRPAGAWARRLIIIVVAYVFIYVGFGMFVARPLAGPAFYVYYKDLKMPAWILPVQMIRALVWTTAALPVVSMSKGKRWEAVLSIGFLFSMLMGIMLIVPNPLMPDPIRRAHLVELLTSNFTFGCLVGYVLTAQPTPQTGAGQLRRAF